MKKKILSAGIIVALAAVAVAGGTLAYFTDTEAENNVFTVGNVDITLNEDFEPNSKLVPGDKDTNNVEKAVTVTNVGAEEAYARVHIAIPAILDDGDPSFDASANVLHFNYSPDSLGAKLWDWSTTVGAPFEGSWNYYETTIGKVAYNVYVVTYGDILASGATTAANAMDQVYLDSEVTNQDIARIAETLGNNWEIKVAAEAVQADGFADAYDALNTAFGVPGTYEVDWAAPKEA